LPSAAVLSILVKRFVISLRRTSGSPEAISA
jgi:hypothetical protein